MELTKLLTSWNSSAEAEIISECEAIYRELYLSNSTFGIQQLHDGESALFHIRTFNHAFYTSSKGPPYDGRKDKFDPVRAARVRWIKALITGAIPGSECWEVQPRSGRLTGPNRLYVIYSPAYLVWLEPRTKKANEECNWNFSTAYEATPRYIRERIQGGNRIAIFKG